MVIYGPWLPAMELTPPGEMEDRDAPFTLSLLGSLGDFSGSDNGGVTLTTIEQWGI